MQYLVYGGAQLLTSDAAASATLSHCVALARCHTADLVRLPVVDAYGSQTFVAIMLGPATTILSFPAPDDVLETDDVAFVADLERRTTAVQHGDAPI